MQRITIFHGYVFHGFGIGSRVFVIDPTPPIDMAVSPWADPPPVCTRPVHLIVCTLTARFSPIGYLIPIETSLLQHRVDYVVAIGTRVVIGWR